LKKTFIGMDTQGKFVIGCCCWMLLNELTGYLIL